MPLKTSSKTSILIVEDDTASREALGALLKQQAYEVIEADGVPAAVEYLYRGRLPGLIILDLKLPGKSGTDLLSEMKLNPLFKQIPVIVVSGLVDRFNISNAVVAIFEKPVDNEKLLNAVADIFSK